MKQAATGWTEFRRAEVVFVCRKCGKRAGRKGVRSELRSELRAAGQRRARVVESGCLSVCPKGGIAIGTAASLAKGEVFVLGRDAGADEAVAALLAERHPGVDQSASTPDANRG